MKLTRTLAASAATLLLLAGCSSDGDDASPAGGGTSDATATDVASGDAPGDGISTGGTGTLTMGDDAIDLAGAMCYLQEQNAAAGGGKILFTGQATGTTGDGEELMIDVSRFDADSMFAGDSIEVVVGDYMNDDSVSYSQTEEGLDAISVDGSTISAEGVELADDTMGEPVTVSFEINC